MDLECDIAILGAGAAGLLCAHYASENEKKVVILEHNKQPGRKILISGGGRCNFTNENSMHSDFVSKNKHFCKSALASFTPQDFIKLVEAYGIEFYEKKLGQLFCKNSAKEIVALLMSKIQKDNVELLLEQSNLEVDFVDDSYEISNSKIKVKAKNLVVATGGLSIPTIGASDLGHRVAKKFGHKIIPGEPALVPFLVDDLSELSGASLVAKVSCGKNEITEDVLFTHKGLSGPAILKISLFWNPGETIKINWIPEHNVSDLILKNDQSLNLEKVLKPYLPNKFAAYIFDTLRIDPKKRIAEIGKKNLRRLEEYIHNWIVVPRGTEGFRKAEVTRGGVETKKVSSKTMESQLQEGLFFIGEVLDVTGQLGGHNFQWAWASAYAAGKYLS